MLIGRSEKNRIRQNRLGSLANDGQVRTRRGGSVREFLDDDNHAVSENRQRRVAGLSASAERARSHAEGLRRVDQARAG